MRGTVSSPVFILMFLLAGLGNPGIAYEKNRHNIGFMAVDTIAARYRFPAFSTRHHAEIAKGNIGGCEALLLKPQTFMNRSGVSLGEAARFYKIPSDHVWVIHDELDLAPGKLRIKCGGGDGGHNGLKSIDQHLGKDYGRIRLGIGRPEHKGEVTSYVLGDFGQDEEAWVKTLLSSLAEALPNLLEGRPEAVMTNVARAMQICGGQEAAQP